MISINDRVEIKKFINKASDLSSIPTFGSTGGPCASFVQNLIKAATRKKYIIDDISSLAIGLIGKRKILSYDEFCRCEDGDILCVFNPNTNNSVHFAIFCNVVVTGQNNVKEMRNVIGVNGFLNLRFGPIPYKNAIASMISSNDFANGKLLYDQGLSYDLYVLNYSLG